MQEPLLIFDTTLRDGEQSPGASMTAEEKMHIARQLERMRVDVIEAGFPAASPGDLAAVKAIAAEMKMTTICALARANQQDVALAAEAVKPAASPRIHTFIATSPLHMREKLRMQPQDVLERAVAAVKQARNETDDVEFSPEDAGRSEPDFLCRIIEAVIEAGATTINIPDTVGYTLPHQFGQLIEYLMANVNNADKAIFSVHCHNDLGLAVANSLAGVSVGARQVECTINGLGERAGNASLEEVVMAVRTRQDMFSCDTRIETQHIVPVSRLVSSITGFPVQPNKAIVGANAFAHESGIHQDGVLKSRETYEIMRAEDVGWAENRMVLGKHSGRRAIRERLLALGIDLQTEEELNDVFKKFKELADKKHEIFDEDLQALIARQEDVISSNAIRLVAMDTRSTTEGVPTATITLEVGGESRGAAAEGDGVVDACFKAVEDIVASSSELLLYSVKNVTAGTDSQGEVSVRLQQNDRIGNGVGSDTDIVIASVKAYVNALNKLKTQGDRLNQKRGSGV